MVLSRLWLTNVGPAAQLGLELAPRLNLITGDNGLGKSFLLDVAWWALSGTWPAEVNPRVVGGDMARPSTARPRHPSILFEFQDHKRKYWSRFNRRAQHWARPPGPGGYSVVLYAQVDGGFAVWDPLRNAGKATGHQERQARHPAFVFTPREVWDGLRMGETQVCNGLVADWALWQKEDGPTFALLTRMLAALSPSLSEPLQPGQLTKLSVDDARWMPTLAMPYGDDVALVHTSAATRRVLALAYLLLWSWEEHLRTVSLLDEPPVHSITLLFDEVECHLHPRWQRTVVRSLFEVIRAMAGEVEVQLIAATHSPLVLASVEPHFDSAQDAWFDLDLESRKGVREVVMSRRQFVRRGDASSWLTSEAFDLRTARSVEAEEVLEEAAHALSDELFDRTAARALETKLRRVLGDTDPFWTRWRFVGERRGWWPGTDDENAPRWRPRKKKKKKKVSKPRSRRS